MQRHNLLHLQFLKTPHISLGCKLGPSRDYNSVCWVSKVIQLVQLVQTSLCLGCERLKDYDGEANNTI